MSLEPLFLIFESVQIYPASLDRTFHLKQIYFDLLITREVTLPVTAAFNIRFNF